MHTYTVLEHPITKTLLIQVLSVFAISILVIATILRPYFFPLHLVEIGLFIVIILKLSFEKNHGNPLINLFWAHILLSFAVVWIISVIFVLDRFFIELQRDLLYWSLLAFFSIIMIFFIIISLQVIFEFRTYQMTTFGIETFFVVWIVMISFIACIFFIFAPTSDVQDLLSRLKNLISLL